MSSPQSLGTSGYAAGLLAVQENLFKKEKAEEHIAKRYRMPKASDEEVHLLSRSEQKSFTSEARLLAEPGDP